MSAFAVSTVKYTPAPAGGDGLKIVTGTLTGTSSYDTGGSTLDLSDYFGSTPYKLDVSCDSGDYQFVTDVATTSTAAVSAMRARRCPESFTCGPLRAISL